MVIAARNPQNSILIIQAPTLLSLEFQKTQHKGYTYLKPGSLLNLLRRFEVTCPSQTRKTLKLDTLNPISLKA